VWTADYRTKSLSAVAANKSFESLEIFGDDVNIRIAFARKLRAD
jgi:hypothetical protein